MDALSDVLRVAQLTGGVFLHAEFTAPWCIAARPSPEVCSPFLKHTTNLIPYHYVVDGAFSLAVGEDEPVMLGSGDIVLMPQGYHPNVAAPGGSINFVWMMAANVEDADRQYGVVNVHPDFAALGSGLDKGKSTRP